MSHQEIDRNARGGLWRVMMWGGAGLLLLAPAVAMQFTTEMAWGPEDFAVFGAMLVAVCVAFELTVRFVRQGSWRLVMGLAVVAAFLLVWAQLAVGIW